MKSDRFPRCGSRRAFLAQLGGLAAGFAPFGRLAAAERADRGPVLVIGAGLAGLYAALELESRGFAVTVLESRDRVGGRLWTLDGVPGRPEGGGNTIGPNYGRVIRCARMLGVPLVEQGRPESFGLMVGGERVAREEWPDLLRGNPLSTSYSWRSPDMSVHDRSAAGFYREQGLDERALAWVNANNSYGNTLKDTSLLSLYRVGASIGRAIAMRQPILEARDGNQRIPEAMAAALSGPVDTGCRVLSLRQTADGVVADCADGQRHEAAAVICTLPLPALRAVEFSPALPAEQRAAVDEIAYHKVTQAHLVTREPYWEEAGAPAGWWTDGPLGRIFTRRTRDAGVFNITCWINGDGCDRFDRMDEDAAREELMRLFHREVPESRGRVELRRMVSWQRETPNQGSWAIWAPGQIGRHARWLGQPHGRVLFAGEHTARANSGMEGAAESGERAALEAMRMLS
ncbi:MAG: FAD-dependent oxidoreductase [Gammaproteobacteria bacterium]